MIDAHVNRRTNQDHRGMGEAVLDSIIYNVGLGQQRIHRTVRAEGPIRHEVSPTSQHYEVAAVEQLEVEEARATANILRKLRR